MKWFSSGVSTARSQSPLSNVILVPLPNLLLILIPSLQLISAQSFTGLRICDFIFIGNLFERLSLIKPIRNECRNIHHGPDCLGHYLSSRFRSEVPYSLYNATRLDRQRDRPAQVRRAVWRRGVFVRLWPPRASAIPAPAHTGCRFPSVSMGYWCTNQLLGVGS